MQSLQARWLLGSAFLLFSACGGDETVEPSGTCGDFEFTAGEGCEDGNTAAGDGCSPVCEVESGWSCVTTVLSACGPVCGDNAKVGDEACDDGNTVDGDGCSSACVIDLETVCDDTVDNDGDGTADCADDDCLQDETCRVSEVCTGEDDEDLDTLVDCDDPDCTDDPACVPFEICTDGADNDGDGATDCEDTGDCTCSCGDGTVQGEELCDDGEANSATEPDACRPDCQPARCGDGVRDAAEACDDGAANGPSAACLTDCTVGDVLTCGTERTLIDLNALQDGAGVWQTSLTPTGTWGDDATPATACGSASGPDAAVRFRAPEAGDYVWYLSSSAVDSAAVAWLSETCDAADAACESPASANGQVAFRRTLRTGEAVWLQVDTAVVDGSALELTVARVSSTLAEDAPCDPRLFTQPCADGLVCAPGDASANVCRVPAVLPGGLDEPCTTATPSCQAGLGCDAGVCRLVAGTSCALPIEVSGDELEDGVTVNTGEDALLAPAGGTCGSIATGGVFALTAPDDGVLIAESDAASVGGVRLIGRSLCAVPASELGCSSASAGNTAVTEWVVERDEVVWLFASAQPARDVEIRFVPVVGEGSPCDREDAVARCSEGLYCSSANVCAVAPAATCANPLNALDLGVGELLIRGVTLGVDTSTTVNSTGASCGTDGRDQVFTFQTTFGGLLSAQLVTESGTGTVSIRRLCDNVRESLSCDSRTASATVLPGERYFIVVQSNSDSTPFVGTLILLLDEQRFPPQSCSDASPCVRGASCVSGSCAWVPVLIGEACVSDEAPCEEGAVCYASLGGPVCARTIPFEGEICDPSGIFGPACGVGLDCRFRGGENVCVDASRGQGEVCRATEDCGAGLVCLGAPLTCQPRPAERGDFCDPAVAASCGTGSLECRLNGEFYVCDFRAAAEGEDCGDEVTCERGFDCIGPRDNTVCVRQLEAGQTCSTDGTTASCAPPLECALRDGGRTCLALGQSGDTCTSTSECGTPFYCLADVCEFRIGFMQPCPLSGPADQCSSGLTCRVMEGADSTCVP